MFLKILYLTLLVLLSSSFPAYPLTLDEILTLKKAGVTDKTIQMILQQEREEILIAERLGIWTTRDGSTIRSTPFNSRGCQQEYYHPTVVHPNIKLSYHKNLYH